MARLLDLTLEFLEGTADGLRRVTQSNWSIQCSLISRERVPEALRSEASFKLLDVPRVYLLIGPSECVSGNTPQHETQLYVGQGDSVADRLDSHMKAEQKKWWRTAIVLRRTENNPLNLTLCKYLESKLYSLAQDAGRCVLHNKVAPQLPFLSRNDQSTADEFLEKALIIVSALGWNSFQLKQPLPAKSETSKEFKGPSKNLEPLLEELRKAVIGSLPDVEWYCTRIPSYRAKVVHDGDFRVYAQIRWARGWFWLGLMDVGKHQLKRLADIDDDLRREIAEAYKKAQRYLQRRG